MCLFIAGVQRAELSILGLIFESAWVSEEVLSHAKMRVTPLSTPVSFRGVFCAFSALSSGCIHTYTFCSLYSCWMFVLTIWLKYCLVWWQRSISCDFYKIRPRISHCHDWVLCREAREWGMHMKGCKKRGCVICVKDKQRLKLITAGGQHSKCIFKSVGRCSKFTAVTLI